MDTQRHTDVPGNLYPGTKISFLYILVPKYLYTIYYILTNRHTDVPGSLCTGTKISFLVAREALRPHWLVFPGFQEDPQIDHFGTLAPQC